MNSLRSRLVVVIGGVALVSVVLASVAVALATGDAINDEVEKRRAAEDEIIARITEESLSVGAWGEMAPLIASLAEKFDASIVLEDFEGHVLAGPNDGPLPPVVGLIDPLVAFGPDGGADIVANAAFNDAVADCYNKSGIPYATGPNGSPVASEQDSFLPEMDRCFEEAARAVFGKDAVGLESPVLLYVGYDTDPVTPWATVLLVVAVVVGIAGAVAFLVSRSLATPITDLVIATRSIRRGRLSVRVEPGGPSEVEELGESFNEMVSELERSDLQRRRLTADVAHELRSPVTNIIGYLDAIDDGVIEPGPEEYAVVRDESIRLGKLIRDLQLLASIDESSLRLDPIPADLRQIVDTAARVRAARAADRGISITVDGDEEVPLVADPERIGQVIGNLLDNAIEHTPRDGRVAVSVTGGDVAATVTVTDSGKGIDPDLLPSIFDRLRRGDAARTPGTEGRGLGLAVARGIARLHGGNVTAENTPDAGARFVVTLPVRDPEH